MSDELPLELRRLDVEAADLDGHSLEELGDYLDRDRTPVDPSIEASAGCQLVLQAMTRLRATTRALIDADIAAAPAPSESWVQQILTRIALDARAGRRIPFVHPSPTADLAITEGAVRGLIRAAELDVHGVLIGRCRLDGDLATPGAPVRVSVEASVLWGERVPTVADRLRAAIRERLVAHTDLDVQGIDVTIRDVHRLAGTPEEDRS